MVLVRRNAISLGSKLGSCEGPKFLPESGKNIKKKRFYKKSFWRFVVWELITFWSRIGEVLSCIIFPSILFFWFALVGRALYIESIGLSESFWRWLRRRFSINSLKTSSHSMREGSNKIASFLIDWLLTVSLMMLFTLASKLANFLLHLLSICCPADCWAAFN